MNRISEALIRFAMREKFLDRFEERLSREGETTIDVFLKKGTEYVVRGRVKREDASPVLSIRNVTGATVPVLYNDGNCFSVIPEEDGLYSIQAVSRPVAQGQEPDTITVTLSGAMRLPRHILLASAMLSCGAVKAASSSDESKDEWSELKEAASM